MPTKTLEKVHSSILIIVEIGGNVITHTQLWLSFSPLLALILLKIKPIRCFTFFVGECYLFLFSESLLYLFLNYFTRIIYRDRVPAGIFTCPKLTVEFCVSSYWRRSGVFLISFEHISYLVLVFLLLTLNM